MIMNDQMCYLLAKRLNIFSLQQNTMDSRLLMNNIHYAEYMHIDGDNLFDDFDILMFDIDIVYVYIDVKTFQENF